ncbi:MAG: hypothetical protein Q8P76_00735 [bacterium]|nr:hypothetical protein [bacterium]
MKESFEKKPRNIETEAAHYEVVADFSPEELIKRVEQVKRKMEREKEDYNKIENFTLFYALSKDSFQIQLSLDHHKLPPGAEWGDTEGGNLTVNTRLQIKDINNHSGSLKDTPDKDVPLVKKAVQKYLDKVIK